MKCRENKVSSCVSQIRGVRGCDLSPFLFNNYVNDSLEYTHINTEAIHVPRVGEVVIPGVLFPNVLAVASFIIFSECCGGSGSW
jgi:hypothetical protein